MATSEIQICSIALLLLGSASFNAFSEDATNLCTNLRETVRQGTLRMANWQCARKRTVLAPLATTPDGEDWTYQMQLPSNWLRIVALGNQGETIDYEVEGRRILCNEAAPLLRYVYDNMDVPSWDSLLTEAVTLHMAWLLSYPITGSNTKTEQLGGQLTALLKIARGVNHSEAPGETIGDRPLMNSRYSLGARF